ncbi:MAG: hypothetical protein ACRBN8_39875 [Nannocystales bacterium]
MRCKRTGVSGRSSALRFEACTSARARTATHRKGRADVEACWTVEFHCASGTTLELPACVQVPHGESRTVDLTDRELVGLETCGGFTNVEVADVQVDPA